MSQISQADEQLLQGHDRRGEDGKESFNPDKVESLTQDQVRDRTHNKPVQIKEAEIIIEKMHPLTGVPIKDIIRSFACFGCSLDSITNRAPIGDKDEDSDCSLIEANNI